MASRRKQKSSRGTEKGGDCPRHGFVLRAIDGPLEGREYLFKEKAVLGRTDDNDILVLGTGVSRQHARVYFEHGVYMVEDLKSANGTRLNGEGIDNPEVLRDGDYITLSQSSFLFSVLQQVGGDATSEMRLDDLEKLAVDHTQTRESSAPKFLGTKRSKLLAVVVVLLVLGGGTAYKLFLADGAKAVIFDQSDVPLTYSDEGSFFEAVYGYGKYDQARKNRVILRFEYLGGRATLQYGAWGVDKVGEVTISLNGSKVGEVPLTMRRWVYGQKLNLPRQTLKKGVTNELIFNNTRNPPHEDAWEICYVQILQEAVPPPDPREARHRFELAKKVWENRALEPSNVYTSMLGFKKTRDLLEGLAEKPPLYQEAVDYMELADKELTTRFQEGLFSARRSQRVDNDVRKARRVLLRTLRSFRKEDFRHRELQRYLDALAEK
ncbi:MAG: FHA domain-containing protein [Deltaproteobacteria bacterium]|nr:FHA domain-containing protein [Deltaproteobacteria bacterium]